jgi:hypothetical protein
MAANIVAGMLRQLDIDYEIKAGESAPHLASRVTPVVSRL